MKRKDLFILPLLILLVGMACLETAEPFATYPVDTPTAQADPTPVITIMPVSGIPTSRPICARVTALQSLHMRAGPSEISDVLGYLYNGDRVIVRDMGEWWKVEVGELAGYARGKYLALTECE